MLSPYVNLDIVHWKLKTLELIAQHPLSLEEIKNIALKTWQILWQTRIGAGESAIRLDEIDVPATVIGYFFEKLYARELEIRYPDRWRGGRSKGEKDLGSRSGGLWKRVKKIDSFRAMGGPACAEGRQATLPRSLWFGGSLTLPPERLP